MSFHFGDGHRDSQKAVVCPGRTVFKLPKATGPPEGMNGSKVS